MEKRKTNNTIKSSFISMHVELSRQIGLCRGRWLSRPLTKTAWRQTLCHVVDIALMNKIVLAQHGRNNRVQWFPAQLPWLELPSWLWLAWNEWLQLSQSPRLFITVPLICNTIPCSLILHARFFIPFFYIIH